MNHNQNSWTITKGLDYYDGPIEIIMDLIWGKVMINTQGNKGDLWRCQQSGTSMFHIPKVTDSPLFKF